MKKSKRLIILDSHAIMHRAYHALPELSSAKGEPTGALYGLVAMLMKIIADLKPDYVVAAADLPQATHRHDVYEHYKGTRAETDDALAAQLNRAHEVYEAFGIPLYEAPGFEADDVIGTIVTQMGKHKDTEVIIASGDLDTLQLVDEDQTRVYTLRKGLNDTVLYDEAAVVERFGFGSDLVPDYKGLRGDPSDNIPGVKGIGEKGATELIQKFGTIEQIYEMLEKYPEKFEEKGIKPRTVKLLTEGKDDAFFSKMLASIRTDAPVKFVLPEHTLLEALPKDAALAFFDELGFRSLGERLRTLLGGTASAMQTGAETKEKEEVLDVDKDRLAEAAVALWLLHSDLTNPTLEDILRTTQKDTLDDAHDALIAELRNTGKLFAVYEQIERPLIPITEAMHTCGITLDTTLLQKLSKDMHKELDVITARIYEFAGHEFNINSPRQLGTVLFDELGLSAPRMKKTAGGARSTRESELEKLKGQHPIITAVLEYRELSKLLSTYVDNLPGMVGDDGRLHARFLSAGTTTGRMASTDPNMQNIPTRGEYGTAIRSAFVASPGFALVALDYSQIELRIAAGLSGDEKLVQIFKEGGDVHAAVASQVFGVPPEAVDYEMRRRAKVINFGILYGMGVIALRQNLGDDVTREEASKFLADYFKNFAGLAHYMEMVKGEAARRGFTETLYGRRRYFAGLDSTLSHVRAAAERMAINAPIQGTEADIIKLAMVRVDEYLKQKGAADDARLLLQVHDELVYEVREGSEQELGAAIKTIMETVVPVGELSDVPIVVDVKTGKNWGDMRTLNL